MKNLAILAFALAFLALAVDKIRNEHAMTRAYDRQAVALERIANGLRDGLYIDNKRLEFMERFNDPDAGLTMEQRVEKTAKEVDAEFCRDHRWPKEIEKTECGQ